MQLDQILELESQKFMFNFEGNGGGVFNSPAPNANSYGSQYGQDVSHAANIMSNVAPNMPMSSFNQVRESLYIPLEIPTYDLQRHVDSLRQQEVTRYQPMDTFRRVEDDYASKPMFYNNPVERLTEHFKPQIGYKINDDLDYHTHGRNENDLSYGHFKYQGRHIEGTDRNGFETAMDCDRFESSGYKKYNMFGTRKHEDDDYNPPSTPAWEPFQPIMPPTLGKYKKDYDDYDDGRGGAPAMLGLPVTPKFEPWKKPDDDYLNDPVPMDSFPPHMTIGNQLSINDYSNNYNKYLRPWGE